MVSFKRGQDSKSSLDVGYSIYLKEAWDNIDIGKGRAFIAKEYPGARTSRVNFEDGYFYIYKPVIPGNNMGKLMAKLKIEDFLLKLEDFEYSAEF